MPPCPDRKRDGATQGSKFAGVPAEHGTPLKAFGGVFQRQTCKTMASQVSQVCRFVRGLLAFRPSGFRLISRVEVVPGICQAVLAAETGARQAVARRRRADSLGKVLELSWSFRQHQVSWICLRCLVPSTFLSEYNKYTNYYCSLSFFWRARLEA